MKYRDGKHDVPTIMPNVPSRDLGTMATKLAAAAAPGKGTPKILATPIDVDGLPDGELRSAHGVLAGCYAYDRMSVSDAVAPRSQHSAWLSMTGGLYVRDFVANLAPRDAIEEAMATQLAVTSGRLNWLTVKLSEARDDADVARLSEAVDRATNAFRRLALAWHQLRGTAPVMPPAAPTIVQNHAAQQVVQVAAPAVTVVSAPRPAPSPPSSNPSSNVEKTPDETTLPPQPPGAGSPPPQDRRQPAVGDVHRPADGVGKGPLERQRLQTRRAEPRRCPSTPANRRGAPAGGRNPPRRGARPAVDLGGSGVTD